MRYLPIASRMRCVNISLLAIVCVLGLMLLTPIVGLANTVKISDAAHVLNASQVQAEASNLPNPINIYTTNTFSGSKTTFDQETRSHITNPNLLVMAIDTGHQHLAIVGGSNVPLSNNQYNDAVQAFVSAYGSNGHNYTDATIASISSLRGALGNSSNSGSPNSSNGSVFPGILGTLLCVGLIVLVVVGALFFVRRRRMGFGRRAMGDPTMYNQPYNQGYPPSYGPGYPPNYGGYNQGGGINPLAAGGIGAAAGGLIGYELGKEQGEDQMRDQGQYQDGGQNNGGNDFGGGGSADFGGGGGGGDFGGGGGGGGDFGGGGGGGGGGDF